MRNMHKYEELPAGLRAAVWRYGAAGLAVFLACAGPALAGSARYDGAGQILLSGKGNTLASIAKDIGKPDVFSYDAQTRTAECRAGITFLGTDGEFSIGKRDDPDAGETLRIVCEADGGNRSRSITVQHATLNIYHSKVVGVTSKIKRGKYRFGEVQYYYAGGGEVVDSEIHSAGMGLQVMTRAPVTLVIKDVKCVNCGCGLLWSADTTDCVWVDGLDVSDGTEYGVLLRLPTSRPGPIVLRNSVFGNSVVALSTITGKYGGSTVLFVNTVVKPNRVWFQDGFGINKIVNAWEQHIWMTDFDQHALPDGKLLLKSTAPDGSEVIPGRTFRMNAAGEAWLPLPVSVITGADKKPKEEQVRNCLEAASGTTVFKTVIEDWQESGKLGWRLERQNDASWTRVSIPYKIPEDLLTDVPENLCANGGFEVETSPGYPDTWSFWRFFEMEPGGWGIMKRGGKRVRFGLDKEVFYEGEKSLAFPPGMAIYHNPPAGIGTKQLFKGKTYTVSFYAKSDKPDTKICLWRWGVGNSQAYFTVGGEWQRYHVTLRDLDQTGMLCFINAPVSLFDIPDEDLVNQGRLWLDAVQVEEGEELHPFMPSGYVCPER